MMNFEERRAEIFRRSDERIKTRKRNTKRILLSCMSLVIFVSVISAVAAYPLTKEHMPEDYRDYDSFPESAADELTGEYAEKSIDFNNALCFGGISLDIPDGWEYDTFEGDDEFSPDGEDQYYGIEIWPSGYGNGKVIIEYSPYFGVCGTGLTEKKTTIGGYEALIGSYDGGKSWSFIALIGEPQRDYVILNDGADEWWSDYGIEAMAILDTLLVGNDISNTDN